MKNTKKILALVLCLMMAAVMLVSCGKSIKGEWVLVDALGNGSTGLYLDMGFDVEVEFTKDEMIMTISYMGESEELREDCKIKSDRIIFDEGYEKYEIDGDTLTLYEATETLIFKRK